MLDFYDILTGLGIGVISLLLSSYIVIWYLRKQIKLEEIVLECLDIALNNVNTDETMQKQIFTIGALLGNGISQGSGLNNSAKRGGKFNMNSLIAEIATNFFTKQLNNPSPSSLQPTPSPSQQINTNRISDKW
jgi:hypothetical protein